MKIILFELGLTLTLMFFGTIPAANAVVNDAEINTVHTDRPSYHWGDYVIISGTIKNHDPEKHVIKIFDPVNSSPISTAEFLPQPNGIFSHTFYAVGPLWSLSGNYTVVVQSGSEQLTTTKFSFEVSPRDGNIGSTNMLNDTSLIKSPLKQFKSGVAAEQVKCKENYQKIFKIKNGYPACVKPSSVSKLMARGWTDWGLSLSEKEKSAILNVAMQDTLFQELITGKNWYVWGINSSVSFENDCPFGSCHEIVIGQTDPNRKLSVLVNSATNKVIDISRTPAW